MSANPRVPSKKREEKKEKERKSRTTRIDAEIETIGRQGEAEISRQNLSDVPSGEEPGSDRDYRLNLKINEVKGTLSLADMIVKKSRGAKKMKIL